MERVRAKVVGI